MAHNLKKKHRRFDSYASSISIFSYESESDSNSSKGSGNETKINAAQNTETIISRPSLESINIFSYNSFARSNARKNTKGSAEPLTGNKCQLFKSPCVASVCKCLVF